MERTIHRGGGTEVGVQTDTPSRPRLTAEWSCEGEKSGGGGERPRPRGSGDQLRDIFSVSPQSGDSEPLRKKETGSAAAQAGV